MDSTAHGSTLVRGLVVVQVSELQGRSQNHRSQRRPGARRPRAGFREAPFSTSDSSPPPAPAPPPQGLCRLGMLGLLCFLGGVRVTERGLHKAVMEGALLGPACLHFLCLNRNDCSSAPH